MLSVISVLATTVQVVRIGHSGATASWSDVGAKTVPAAVAATTEPDPAG